MQIARWRPTHKESPGSTIIIWNDDHHYKHNNDKRNAQWKRNIAIIWSPRKKLNVLLAGGTDLDRAIPETKFACREMIIFKWKRYKNKSTRGEGATWPVLSFWCRAVSVKRDWRMTVCKEADASQHDPSSLLTGWKSNFLGVRLGFIKFRLAFEGSGDTDGEWGSSTSQMLLDFFTNEWGRWKSWTYPKYDQNERYIYEIYSDNDGFLVKNFDKTLSLKIPKLTTCFFQHLITLNFLTRLHKKRQKPKTLQK